MSAPRPVLVAYATRQGFTREVAEVVASTIDAAGAPADLRAASAVRDLQPYGGVVLGAPLYTGRWHRDMRRLVHRLHRQLAEHPVAVFALGPRTLEAADVSSSREQLDRALAAIPDLDPVSVALFGGAIDPERLRFPFNRMPASDARDWDAIRAWAAEVAPLVGDARRSPA